MEDAESEKKVAILEFAYILLPIEATTETATAGVAVTTASPTRVTVMGLLTDMVLTATPLMVRLTVPPMRRLLL